jgi:carbamoyl-phosphate synthase large subunit
MPKRTDIKSILIIGAGPDRHRPGLRVRLFRRPGLQGAEGRGLSGHPDQLQPGHDHDRSGLADATYVEPITPEFVERIIEKEKPDALLPTMGGQTALNTALSLRRTPACSRSTMSR